LFQWITSLEITHSRPHERRNTWTIPKGCFLVGVFVLMVIPVGVFAQTAIKVGTFCRFRAFGFRRLQTNSQDMAIEEINAAGRH